MTKWLINPGGRGRPKKTMGGKVWRPELARESAQTYRGFLIVPTPYGWQLQKEGAYIAGGYDTPEAAKKDVTLYLANPTGRKRKMARKTPARGKNGRFLKGGRKAKAKSSSSRKRRRSAPAAATTTRKRRKSTVARRKRRAPARRARRRSTRRRNPALMSQLRTGLKDAAAIVVGKAGARIIPTLIPGVPRTGPVGLLVQAASAVGLGYLADRFVGRDLGRQILAGALSAPIETAVVAYRVPLLGPALDPTSSAALVAAAGSSGMAAYVRPRALPRRAGVGAYVNPRRPVALAGYKGAGWAPGMGM